MRTKEISKSKALLAVPELLMMQNSWRTQCLKTRENMLSYFSALEPLSFKQALFPLPPVFDAKRQWAIDTLEALDVELRKTLESTKSIYRQKAEELSHANSKFEKQRVFRKELQNKLENLQEVKQTPPEFRSGEHILTGGWFTKKLINLFSPCEKSCVKFLTHNCQVSPDYESKPVFGKQFELTVTPKWLATVTKQANDEKLWNWFAQVWLEYKGSEYYQKEIADVQSELAILAKEIALSEAALDDLNKRTIAIDPELEGISSRLNNISFLRDFLKEKTFNFSSLEILSKACPLEDMQLLLSLLKANLPHSSSPEIVQVFLLILCWLIFSMAKYNTVLCLS